MNKYSDFLQHPKSAIGSHRLLTPNFSRPITSISSSVRSCPTRTIFFPDETFNRHLLSDIQSAGFEIPDPGDPNTSRYVVPIEYPERPKTSLLSGLTMIENRRSHIKSQSLFKSVDDEIYNSPVYRHRKMPSEVQFTKVLDKLEMVISNKNLVNQKVYLKDGSSMDILLDESTIQYFKVQVRNKRCPL